MQYSPLLLLTFALLVVSIMSVWLRPTISKFSWPVQPDMTLLGVAALFGILGGYLTFLGAGELVVVSGIAFAATATPAPSTKKRILAVIAALLALLLAMHLLPGFHNPKLLDKVNVSAGAVPFTLYANFDKAAAGLILLVFFCRRTTSLQEFFVMLKKAAPLTALTIVGLISAALLLKIVRVDVKLPPFAFAFLITNLFFTCVAEEAFFRGLLQEKLSVGLKHFRYGEYIAIGCSALLFGVVHLAGGAAYAALATLAGLGYACIYSATKRVEAPIVAHFLFNLVHFTGFSYPYLAQSV